MRLVSTIIIVGLLLVFLASGPSPAAAQKTITESEKDEESPLSEAHKEAVDVEDHNVDAETEVYQEDGVPSAVGTEDNTQEECPVNPINNEQCGGANQGKCDTTTGTCECVVEPEGANAPYYFGAACECGSTKETCLAPHCFWCEQSSACVVHREDCGKMASGDGSNSNSNNDATHRPTETEKEKELEADVSGDLTTTATPHIQSNAGGGTAFFVFILLVVVGVVVYAKQKKILMFSEGSGGMAGGGGSTGRDTNTGEYRSASYDELQTMVHADDEDEEVGYDMRSEGWRSGQTFVSVN